MSQTKIERLSATHRESSQRATFAIGFRGILRLDERDEIFEQILLEIRKRRGCCHHVALGTIVLLRATVRQDYDHRDCFLFRDEIVENDFRMAVPMPLLFVTANTV